MGILAICFCFAFQTGVSGQAVMSWEEQGPICGNMGKELHLFADLSGLKGSGGAAAGLNSFVVTLGFDRPDVFASAFPGQSPRLDWGFQLTDEAFVALTDEVTLVGWVPDTEAPNQKYQLATLNLNGTAGAVTVSTLAVSLGSRVAQGDGPGPIIPLAPDPILVVLPGTYALTLLEGGAFWTLPNVSYDTNGRPGVDISDLVSVINCGG